MTQSLTPIIYVLAFVAVVLLIQTTAGVFFRVGDRARRVNRRLTMLESGMAHDEVYSALVRKPLASGLSNPRLQDAYSRASTYLGQADLNMSPLRLAAITAGVAAALWLAAFSFVSSSGKGGALFVNGVTSLVGACTLAVLGVWVWVSRRRTARLKKLEEQLPLGLDVVIRAVRAGHPVVSAVQLASEEMGDPLGTEFGLIVDETTYGAEFKEALASFARRTGSPDAHFFAVSVSIQSETGGNLAEILEGLVSVMRGRITLGKRVKALASEGRASALLLSVLPLAMIALQLVTRPSFYTSKFSDPLFWPIVALTAVIYFIGWMMIHRIINFKY